MNQTIQFLYLLFLSSLFFVNSAYSEVTQPGDSDRRQVISDSENQLAEKLFEEAFQMRLSRNPEFQTRLGIHGKDDKWNDISYRFRKETYDLGNAQWKKISKTLNFESLDYQNKLSYRLMAYNNKKAREGLQYWYHDYLMDQMHGVHAAIPAFLINFHPSRSTEDLDNYIARLDGVEKKIEQLIKWVKKQEKMDIMPPAFVFPYLISDSQNIISGQPFDHSEKDSPLFEDFKNKVKKLGLKQSEQKRLVTSSSRALLKSVKPAYTKLIQYLKNAQKRAGNKDGVWKLPQGDKFYKHLLTEYTTTDLTATEIHQTGLKEVSRIHEEMREIVKQLKFKGNLQDFFEYTRTSDKFYLPDTEAGKQDYLDLATGYIGEMQKDLDRMFKTQPEIDLKVKAVESFREKSAGKAFYSRPSPDGQRPGTFYVNLYQMDSMPTYELEALAYHEGIPGHHLQLAISVALEGLPKFRKFGGYTAYTEGWGLYSERLAKDFGFYQDPYSDFGRLAMELWRAARLVVDTGIHDKKWTREEAIGYLKENTPNPLNQIVKGIERYIVMPGQATAYKIGMIKLLELRNLAKSKIGEKFDIREYHEQVLTNGALPLWLLEENIESWASE